MNMKSILLLVGTIVISGCATTASTKDANSIPKGNLNSGEIFTYEFDPRLPQVDSGVSGILVVDNGCLLIQAPARTVLITPILPEGISRWDKGTDILYIENRVFRVGDVISTNGVILYGEEEVKAARSSFKSEAPEQCLKNRLVRIGTHFGSSAKKIDWVLLFNINSWFT